METAQIIRPAKKIKVVGCCNCPYVFLGEDNRPPHCQHPSFGSRVIMECARVFDPNNPFPTWCPLENDVEAVVITNPVSGFNTKEEKKA